MDWVTEIIKMALSALAGGGVLWLFNFRRQIKRQGNELEGDDFNLVSKTVKQAMSDLAGLSERIGQLETEKVNILDRISGLERENKRLKKENEHLEGVLRAYIEEKNPQLKR